MGLRDDLLDFLGLSPNQIPNPQYSGALVVCGSGRCVWDDLQKIPGKTDFMAVNDMGMHLPFDLAHWFSNDAESLLYWKHCRRRGYNQDFRVHSCNKKSGIEFWPWPGQGTSSLNAVYTGIGLGYEDIYLAGVPLDDSGHYWEAPWLKSNFTKEVPDRNGLPRCWEFIVGRIHTFSGRLYDHSL